MKYQKFFQQADFSIVWACLHGYYKELLESKHLYEIVFNKVRNMPVDSAHSMKRIEIVVTEEKEVIVIGAPDPQEWLVGRDVEIEYFNDVREPSDVNTLTAHLLYWSTLYGIKTQKMQEEEFGKWLDYQMRGPYYILPDNDLKKIGESVMVKYIFLDIDGVLNTERYQAQLAIEGKPTKDEFGPLFDPKAVARLAKIVEETKAEIFIISSWGEVLGEDKIIEMWKKRGLPGEVRVVFVPDDKCSSKGQWIKERLDSKIFLPYIILDDESVFFPEQEKHFYKVNPVVGLTKEIEEWSIEELNELDNLPPSAFDDKDYEEELERIGRINAESCNRKKLLYWKGPILADVTYDWSWNLIILRKKLEYNIGYYRFTQRYVGWEQDVNRMELACRLMKIVTGGNATYYTGKCVNTRNCSRFNIDSSKFKAESEFLDACRIDLRKEKAYRLVWTVLQQNMKRWYD